MEFNLKQLQKVILMKVLQNYANYNAESVLYFNLTGGVKNICILLHLERERSAAQSPEYQNFTSPEGILDSER